MTQPDLSSLALPDSPELPAEIERGMLAIMTGVPDSVASLRSVIAKHLLTAEQIEDSRAEWQRTADAFAKDVIYYLDEIKKLREENERLSERRLSGSSRGEE